LNYIENIFLFSYIFAALSVSFKKIILMSTIEFVFGPPTIRTIFRIVLLSITDSLHSAKYSTALIR